MLRHIYKIEGYQLVLQFKILQFKINPREVLTNFTGVLVSTWLCFVAGCFTLLLWRFSSSRTFSYLLNKSIMSQHFACFHDTDNSSLKIHFPVFIHSTSGLLHLLPYRKNSNAQNTVRPIKIKVSWIYTLYFTKSGELIKKLQV